MRFTSIDLEMNQPSGRIIQIGAAVFDTDRGLITTWSNYVDPGEPVNWNHPLNIGCSLEELLAPGFREAWTSHAQPTAQAIRDFWEWYVSCQAGKKFIQWGRGDVAQLIKESRPQFGTINHLRVFDLKMAYQFFWQPGARLEKHSQLGTACQNMKSPPPAPAHDALADAVATGELFLKMFRQVEGVNNLLGKLS